MNNGTDRKLILKLEGGVWVVKLPEGSSQIPLTQREFSRLLRTLDVWHRSFMQQYYRASRLVRPGMVPSQPISAPVAQ